MTIPTIPRAVQDSHALVAERWRVLGTAAESQAALADEASMQDVARFSRNIENFIGTVKVPVGIAGPLRVQGMHARGDYYLPLATTEAALVASYSRGAQIITEAGGCAAALLAEGVGRAPGFAFASLAEAATFARWVEGQYEAFATVTARTSAHAKLLGVRASVEGNHVYVQLEFRTGEAAGQNMVTLATAAILQHVAATAPVKCEHCFLEANYSGDKKASAHSLTGVRGKRVSAEVRLPRALVADRLHTTPECMTEYWRMAALAGVLTGTVGVQGQFANGLAALYIACGQDAACVAESATGVTRLETRARRRPLCLRHAAERHRRLGRRRHRTAEPARLPGCRRHGRACRRARARRAVRRAGARRRALAHRRALLGRLCARARRAGARRDAAAAGGGACLSGSGSTSASASRWPRWVLSPACSPARRLSTPR